MIISKKSYFLYKSLNFRFLKHLGLFIIISSKGYFVLKMPKIFFLKNDSTSIYSFVFLNNYHFQSFIKLFNVFYRRLFLFYFFRLKLRGMGFRIKRLCSKLYRFYFIRVNFMYLHVPREILIKLKKRKIFIVSCDFSVLQTLINKMLLIKAVTAYRRTGLLYPNEIVLMKPGKKRI